MGYDRTYYSSKQKTMEQLNQFAQKGLGIVVVTADLPENLTRIPESLLEVLHGAAVSLLTLGNVKFNSAALFPIKHFP